ncbi:hypothetical protein ACWDRB_40955 [Nonomuraea sp. NPDC003707]
MEIVPVTGSKPRLALVLRPVFDYTAPDPFAGQRPSWTTARSPWRDKGTDTIGLCCLDELNTTPGHFAPRPATPGQRHSTDSRYLQPDVANFVPSRCPKQEN